MYKANLAWNRMTKYLNFLIKAGLVEEQIEEEGKRYSLTKRGLTVLEYFSKVAEVLEIEVKL